MHRTDNEPQRKPSKPAGTSPSFYRLSSLYIGAVKTTEWRDRQRVDRYPPQGSTSVFEPGGNEPLDGGYVLEDVAKRVRVFFVERAAEAGFKAFLILRICGYSAGRPLPEVWQIAFENGSSHEPVCVQKEGDAGTRWNGEEEALDRLIMGLPRGLGEGAIKEQLLTKDQLDAALPKLYPYVWETLIMNTAPVQDAIDLARFMVETTKGFMRFSIKRPKTVSGSVEIAAITKHEGLN